MSTLNQLAADIKDWREHQGFTTPHCLDGHVNKAEMLGKLMLVTTEVSEMAEAVRVEDSSNFAEELADVIIRILDIGCTMGIDIDSEVHAKMEKNRNRPKLHGKKCLL